MPEPRPVQRMLHRWSRMRWHLPAVGGMQSRSKLQTPGSSGAPGYVQYSGDVACASAVPGTTATTIAAATMRLEMRVRLRATRHHLQAWEVLLAARWRAAR